MEMAIEYFQRRWADHGRSQRFCELPDRANNVNCGKERGGLLFFRDTTAVGYKLIVHRTGQVHVAILVVDRQGLP